MVLVSAIAAWVAVQLLGHDPFRLVAGFGVMALVGLGLELQPRPDWRPRYCYAVNAAALVALVICGVKLYRGRNTTSPAHGS